jgi:hypothetical protein
MSTSILFLLHQHLRQTDQPPPRSGVMHDEFSAMITSQAKLIEINMHDNI